MKPTLPDWVSRELAAYFERQSSLSKLVEVCITGIQALADNPRPVDPGVDRESVELSAMSTSIRSVATL
jgi:hypothetical protein